MDNKTNPIYPGQELSLTCSSHQNWVRWGTGGFNNL